MLYASEIFGISLGNEVSFNGVNPNVEWLDPGFYRRTTFGRQTIARLPHNAFHLIQNLELNFTDEAMLWQTKASWDLIGSTDKLLRHISQTCANLEDCVQLQRLDINLSFCCKFDDIEYMTRLLEPIKKLRGIHDPNITVCGHQFADSNDPTRILSSSLNEPRWGLTDEFTEYLEQLLMAPHGTPVPPSDEMEVFEDDYEWFGPDEHEHWKETDEQFMRRYLRDVYGTENIEALQGGMPERWQVWLNSEHGEGCDWINLSDEEAI